MARQSNVERKMSKGWHVVATMLSQLVVFSSWGQQHVDAADKSWEEPESTHQIANTDARLDALLASDREPSIRLWEFLQFNRAYSHLVGEIYLGAHGEILGLPQTPIDLPTGITTYAYRGGLLLIAPSRFPELGLEPTGQFARVHPNGRITCYVQDDDVSADLSAMPRWWPTPEDGQSPQPPGYGEVLFLPPGEGHSRNNSPPAGATGWLIQGVRGYFYIPRNTDFPPEYAVWVIPEGDGGFRLLEGGPKGPRLLMEVEASGTIRLSENSLYRESRQSRGPLRWVLKDNRGRAALFPPGSGAFPLTDGTVRMQLSVDGAIQRDYDIVRY